MSATVLYESILQALERDRVRYVIVGGVATVLHGYARVTLDLDLVIDLDRATEAIGALTALGLAARLPVDPYDFADQDIRRRWVEERNLTVFTLSDPSDPFKEVDIFAENPIPFEDLWTRSKLVELGSMMARVASIADLITMKRMAGRPQDTEDIEALEAILRLEGNT